MRRQRTAIEAANIFTRAAAYIRKCGWQEEGMGEHGRPRCSMGALDSAFPELEWDKNLANLMYETLYEELDGRSLTQYNHEVETGEEVARLYDRVARRLENV